jgi:hypothetical protein
VGVDRVVVFHSGVDPPNLLPSSHPHSSRFILLQKHLTADDSRAKELFEGGSGSWTGHFQADIGRNWFQISHRLSPGENQKAGMVRFNTMPAKIT